MKHLTLLTIIGFLLSCNNNNTTSNDEKPSFDPDKYLAETSSERPIKERYNDLTAKQKESVLENLRAPEFTEGSCNALDFLSGRLGESVTINDKSYFYKSAGLYEGRVCLEAKNFSGNSPYNIPFVMRVLGEVSEIYVDGKIVSEYKGKPGEIFFRKNIALEMGYNRIAVKVVGRSGKETEGYIVQNIESIPEQIEIKNN